MPENKLINTNAIDEIKITNQNLLKTIICIFLVNVINHCGSMQFGHYYTYCLNNENKKWYVMNDDKISYCDKVITNEAYILVYEHSSITNDH